MARPLAVFLFASFLSFVITATQAPAQVSIIGPQGQPLGSVWRMGPQDSPSACQNDIILVVPPSRNRALDDFFSFQERTQKMFENKLRYKILQDELESRRRNTP